MFRHSCSGFLAPGTRQAKPTTAASSGGRLGNSSASTSDTDVAEEASADESRVIADDCRLIAALLVKVAAAERGYMEGRLMRPG